MKRSTYLEENDAAINEDILFRKEFQLYKKNTEMVVALQRQQKHDRDKNIIPNFLVNMRHKGTNYLVLEEHQLFMKNYFNPNTPYTRLLLKWDTGIGKTVGAISIALNFINYYQKEELFSDSNVEIGSVFVIGFTKRIFVSELLKFPELGFLSRTERIKLDNLKERSYTGNPASIEAYKKFALIVRKRLYSRKGNGFFKFIGYKELTNRLFVKKDRNVNIHSLSQEEVFKAIANGRLVLNRDVLMSFKNSLLICDEIHNVYNSVEKNNWGASLQIILDSHESCRALFLSATPLNNSPTEVIDLLNLLVPRSGRPNDFKREEFFDKNESLDETKDNKIRALMRGRISFIKDTDPERFAEKIILGDRLPGVKENIKFIRCPMSKFHYATYRTVIKTADDVMPHDGHYLTDFAIPDIRVKDPFGAPGIYSAAAIRDVMNSTPQAVKNKYKIHYLPRNNIISGDILQRDSLKQISFKYYTMLTRIYDKIKNKKGKTFIYHNYIHMSGTLFIKEVLSRNGIIDEFEQSTDDTLCAICSKTRREHSKSQLTAVSGGDGTERGPINEVPTGDGWISVRLNDRELLQYFLFDGYKVIPIYTIDPDADPKELDAYIRDATDIVLHRRLRCDFGPEKDSSVCLFKELLGRYSDKFVRFDDGEDTFYFDHAFRAKDKYKLDFVDKLRKKIGRVIGGDDHFFQPVRFVIIHSNLDKKVIETSMEKFNSINNVHGHKYMIIIGSKIIKESYSMNSVKNLLVMRRPDNISTLIQIIGRAVRLNSHRLLPLEERKVEIELYTSCLPTKTKSGEYELGYNEIRYLKKIQTHKVIQRLEKIMHENAIDKYFNYDTIWRKNDNTALDILPYENQTTKTFKLSELNLSTFNAYYRKNEVEYVMYIIKRLFVETSVLWKYNDMWKAAQSPPFSVEIDTSLLSQDVFDIALTNLLYVDDATKFVEPIIQKINDATSTPDLVDVLRDPVDKLIYLRGVAHVISQMNEFYILAQLDNNYEIVVDIESIYRSNQNKRDSIINVNKYLKFDLQTNYNEKKARFYKKWSGVSISNLESAICDFGMNFHESLLEDCIQYVFHIWTDPKVKKDELHAFYIKFLYYYDLQKIVVWGNTLNDTMAKKYTKYMTPSIPAVLKNTKRGKINEEDIKSSGLINFLNTTLNRSDPNWISTGMRNEYNKKLHAIDAMFAGRDKKGAKLTRASAELVPVGHFIGRTPKFYHPNMGGWHSDPAYIETDAFVKENSIIVGYDERSDTGISVKFKVRNPIQNIKKFKDTRMIEKGSVCSTKSKTYLYQIAKKIDIKIEGSINVDDLCMKIRTKLIYLELKEQIRAAKEPKYKPLKYFYFVFQTRPETV